MENEVCIEKLINSLKNRLDKNSALYRNTYFGNVVLSKVKFYLACTDEELKNIVVFHYRWIIFNF